MSQLGQKAKYSLRAHIVRFAAESGLKSDVAGGPFRAIRRLAQFAQVTRMPTSLVLACAGGVRPERVQNLLILLDPFRGHWFAAAGPC